MQINTGQVVSKTRSACLNKTNILTLLFAVLLYVCIEYGYFDYYIQYPLWAIYSLYILKLGLSISESQTQLRQLNNNGMNIGIRIVEIGQNRVTILQSLMNVLKFVAKNIIPALNIILITVALQLVIYFVMDYLVTEQYMYAESIMKKMSKKLSKIDNLDELSYNDMLFIDFQQIISTNGKQLQKMYESTIKIFMFMIGYSVLRCILTWFQISALVCAQWYDARQKQIKIKRNIIIPTISLFDVFKVTYYTYFRLNVIAAQFRLFLRFWWVFMFLWLLQPYYYICLAFFVRQITPGLNSNISATFIIPKQNKTTNNQQQSTQQKQQQVKQQKSTRSQINIYYQGQKYTQIHTQNLPQDYSKKQQLKSQNFQNDTAKQSKQYNPSVQTEKTKQKEQINTNLLKDNKQQMQRLHIQNVNIKHQVYELLNQRLTHQQFHPILSNLLKTLDKNIKKTNQKKNKQKKNNVSKLIYRPYFNDIIQVKQF